MISVCMAVYNGGKFVEVQLESILAQLGPDDEILVVDDASTDDSRGVIDALGDTRIRVLTNRKNRGVLKSFERALEEARGDYIFFSDQDDYWLPRKVDMVIDEFVKSGVLAVVTDAQVIDNDGSVIHGSYFKWRNSGPGVIKNFHKNTFLGCCMAIRKECKKFLLPFPPLAYMHDQWTGLACSMVGRVHFLPEKLIAYRRHQDTVTQMHPSSLWWIIKKRTFLALSLLAAFPRLLKWRLKSIAF